MSTQTYLIKYKYQHTKFILPPEYDVLSYIGHGSFGVVCEGTKAIPDLEDALKTRVAIKRQSLCSTNDHWFCELVKRTIRELKILQYMTKRQESSVILKIIDVLATEFDPNGRVSAIYMVTPFMDTDLQKLLENTQEPMVIEVVKYLLYELLCGIQKCHKNGIVHRDLKPSNILVNDNWDIVICDFGAARTLTHGDMTNEVVTLCYRCPEMLMGLCRYDDKIDVWSLGCVFAQLLSNTPQTPIWKGSSTIDQLVLIFRDLGVPTIETFCAMGCPQTGIDAFHGNTSLKVPINAEGLNGKLNPALCLSENVCALDLLQGMLAIDPAKRYTVDECLQSPFFDEFKQPGDVATTDINTKKCDSCGRSTPPPTPPFEDDELLFHELQRLDILHRCEKLNGMLKEQLGTREININ